MLSLSTDEHSQAVYWQGEWHSRAQLWRDVGYVGQRLLLAKPATVLLACEDSYYFCVAFLAAAQHGVSILLPPNYQTDTLETLAASTAAFCMDDSWLAQALALDMPVVDMSYSLDQNTAITLNTSGSSGAPVCIDKQLKHLLAEVAVLQQQWPLTPSNIVLGTVSHTHIYGLLYRVLWPLVSGAAWYADPIDTQEALYACLTRDSIVVTSPAFLSRLDAQLTAEHRVESVFSSGGALSYEAAQRCQHCFAVAPLEVYGSTETGGVAWRQRTQEQPLWTLFDCVQAQLDSDGVLSIASPYIPDADQPMRMGDRARLDGRQLALLGRVDRIVKLHEKRISLTLIESILLANDWVSQCRILVFQHRLAAVVCLNTQGEALFSTKGKRWLVEQLKSQLLAYIERVALPRRWRFVAELPLNEQGKITHDSLMAIIEQTA